jgi:excisionase family DNA binding protein
VPEPVHPFPEDDLVAFSYKQAAARLGLSEVTTKRLCYAGTIRTLKVGRRVLIPASAIRAFLTATTA